MRKPTETASTGNMAETRAVPPNTAADQEASVALLMGGGGQASAIEPVQGELLIAGGKFIIRRIDPFANLSTVDNAGRVFAVVIEGVGRLRSHLASAAAAVAEAFPAARVLLAVETEALNTETVSRLVADGLVYLVAPLPLSLATLTADLHRLWLLWRLDGAVVPASFSPVSTDAEPLMVGEGTAMREVFARHPPLCRHGCSCAYHWRERYGEGTGCSRHL